jgi:hypothetical protein
VRKRKGLPPQSFIRSGDSPELIRVADLAERTIEDPFLDKCLLDRGYEDFLQHHCLNQVVHAQDLKSRITEVYRQCYERSSGNPSVITDFVAAYPELSFDAEWLRVLVGIQTGNRDFSSNGPRCSLFRAIAAGFRRVANPKARFNRSVRRGCLEAAQYARADIDKDLNEWEKTLDRNSATREWIAEQATEKVKQLVASNPRLKSVSVENRLIGFLGNAHLYKATNLMLSKIYRVPVRSLETQQP